MVFIGATEQMTASATLTNGTPQTPACTWGADAPAVASINPATGLVTAVASGNVTVWCDASGRRGTKLLRILPNYAGTWSGSYFITGCSHSGAFATGNFCGNFSTNQVLPYNFVLTQSADSVAGRFFLGTIQFDQTTAPVSLDGSMILTSRSTSGTTSIDVVWSVNSTQAGRVTGTHHQIWRSSGLSGQGDVNATIRDSSRTNAVMVTLGRPITSLGDALSAIVER
jgi:Bacterial Ig-like domain (group 2)